LVIAALCPRGGVSFGARMGFAVLRRAVIISN
jgi:hypothetical protein